MIDLHTHTDASDGTLSARELMNLAGKIGIEALAITDHDTLSGYDEANSMKEEFPFELLCGIEISTRYKGKSVHLLGYFLNGGPSHDFCTWILQLQATRQKRNHQLVEKLRSHGIDITLAEVTRRGKKVTGRPHFAAVLVEKGHASSIRDAFHRYLDESACCYVPRDELAFSEAIERILAGGGLPALPHPNRITRDAALLEQYIDDMKEVGLRGIEVYHSDHSPSEIELYTSLAQRFSLAVTGGSDFHGMNKPSIALGTGVNGNLCIPKSVLQDLRLNV